MGVADYEQVVVTTRAQFRAWLERHAGSSPGAWVVTSKRGFDEHAPRYEDVVEECLCFGWIDSTYRSRDETTGMQLVTPRRPRSTWSASNKARVERLLAAGRMTERGLRAVEVARANGSWEALDPVERLEVPDDLAAALSAHPAALAGFDALAPAARKQLLWWVLSARRPQTRAARIERIVADALDRAGPVG